MKVLQHGFKYFLPHFESRGSSGQTLQFVEKIPSRVESPILKTRVAGATTEDVILALTDRMAFLDSKIPCGENKQVISLLIQCSELLYKRTLNRQSRGVKGINAE